MQLPIDLTFRDMEPDPALEALVRTEAAKLERYFAPLIRCSVIVERPHKATDAAFCRVRLEVTAPQRQLIVSHDPSHAGATDRAKPNTDPRAAIREAFRQMRRQLEDHARQLRGDIKTRSEARSRGTVIRLFPAEGYGFLEADGGREIYFHRRSVLNDHFETLRLGTAVEYVEEAGDKGPQATTVRLLRPRRQAQAAAVVALPPQPVH